MEQREFASMGGKASAAALTARERKKRAQRAIKIRWDRYYKANPKTPAPKSARRKKAA